MFSSRSTTAINAIAPFTARIAGPSRLRLPAVRAICNPAQRPIGGHPASFILPRANAQRIRYNSSASSSSSSKAAPTPPLSTVKEERDVDVEDESLRIGAPQPGAKSQPIAQVEPRLSLTFTCTHNDCNHRSTHEFSKRAYTKGIVLVQCPECKSRHLIADHIGWFKESTEEGKLKTVEDLVKAKGEKVRTGRVNFDGDVEYDPES